MGEIHAVPLFGLRATTLRRLSSRGEGRGQRRRRPRRRQTCLLMPTNKQQTSTRFSTKFTTTNAGLTKLFTHQGGKLGRSRDPQRREHVHRYGAGLAGGRIAPRRRIPVRVRRHLRRVRQADKVRNKRTSNKRMEYLH